MRRIHTAVLHASLSKEYGALHIGSTPSNAHVYIDGKRQGQLDPIRTDKFHQGNILSELKKTTFISYEEEVMVEQGKTLTLEADLIRQVGGMVIETQPPGPKRILGAI